MSIKIMTLVWQNGPEKQSERFVLLALADYANDDGECWPSIAGLMQKTCLSERGIQSVIRRLCADGWLEIEAGGGRRNCNLYTIITAKLAEINPAPPAPRSICTPQMDAETPQMDAVNPAPPAPEPSLTIIEPSDTITPASILEQFASSEAVASFLAYRKKHKARALTLHGAKLLGKTLSEINQRGGDADEALGMTELSGWAAIQPSWYFKRKDEENGDRNSGRRSGAARSGPADALIHGFAASTVHY